LSNALNLFYAYFQTQQTNQAIKVLDQLTTQPTADVSTLVTVASAYAQLGHAEGLLNALLRLVKLMPDNPEAWYDLAGIQATMGKAQDAIRSLTRALQLSNDRLSRQPEAKDLAAIAAKDTRFAGLRGLPEFQRLLSGKP
jgi:regulator of sirC expression with transglutaminase-like and TPR domain